MTSSLTSRIFEAASGRRTPEWDGLSGEEVRPRATVAVRQLPRYLLDRVSIRARSLTRGKQPWVTQDSLDLLDQLLTSTSRGLEYGSGGTTTWFAERIEFLYSVEGGDTWHAALQQELTRRGVANVDHHLASSNDLGYNTPEHLDAYVNAFAELPPASLDFVFIDGEYRDECAMRALELLKPGGLLVLDNAELYLPDDTRSPWSVDRPISPLWEKVAAEIASWRRVSTTNGVWDTVIWFKP